MSNLYITISLLSPVAAILLLIYTSYYLYSNPKIPSKPVLLASVLINFIQQIAILIYTSSYYSIPKTITLTPLRLISLAIIHTGLAFSGGLLFEANLRILSTFSVIVSPTLNDQKLKHISIGIWTAVGLYGIFEVIVTIMYFVNGIESSSTSLEKAMEWETMFDWSYYILIPFLGLSIIYDLYQSVVIVKTIMKWKKNNTDKAVLKVYNWIVVWIILGFFPSSSIVLISIYTILQELPYDDPLAILNLAYAMGIVPTFMCLVKTVEYTNIKLLTFEGVALRRVPAVKNEAVEVHKSVKNSTVKMESDTVKM